MSSIRSMFRISATSWSSRRTSVLSCVFSFALASSSFFSRKIWCTISSGSSTTSAVCWWRLPLFLCLRLVLRLGSNTMFGREVVAVEGCRQHGLIWSGGRRQPNCTSGCYRRYRGGLLVAAVELMLADRAAVGNGDCQRAHVSYWCCCCFCCCWEVGTTGRVGDEDHTRSHLLLEVV